MIFIAPHKTANPDLRTKRPQAAVAHLERLGKNKNLSMHFGRVTRMTHDFLVEGEIGYEWHCVLIMPRTKDTWMIAELDRYLDDIPLDNTQAQIMRGHSYSYITVLAEIPEDTLPNEINGVSKELRTACAKARNSYKSVFGWCDLMPIRQFVAHDRRMAEECFGLHAVSQISQPNKEGWSQTSNP